MTNGDAEATDERAPGGTVGAYWDRVIEDMEATADQFEERGWDALTLRPGDVTPVVGDDVDVAGFDVLLPDDEWHGLLDVVENATLDECDVYSTSVENTSFCVVAMQDLTAETAVLFPIYFDRNGDDATALREHAESTGSVRARLRRLQQDRLVTFELAEPALVFPDLSS